MNVLVTGSRGFIGKNLVVRLNGLESFRVTEFDKGNDDEELEEALAHADFIFHLAGVNRPKSADEFKFDNVDLTKKISNRLMTIDRSVPVVFSSSTQAELDNPYGESKRQAEEVLVNYARSTNAYVVIFRLANVFGKWSQPNYNSVVATFCHNIANNLPITISDPSREINFIHVDDVVCSFLEELIAKGIPGVHYRTVAPSYTVTLGRLVELLNNFRLSRKTLLAPNFSDEFTKKLYGTFLSYLPIDDFAYDLEKRSDSRGSLAEFIKSEQFGQIFVSRTKPGVTRGNHFHHTKTEKFLVLEGDAIIRFRHLQSKEVIQYPIRGEDFRVVDIPTGYTHSIENVGDTELVTLFWASEIFNPDMPDTTFEEV
jgi:UDP-2-acetamido-2,6-beta-L-arabino-hexul-4-ose reductase